MIIKLDEIKVKKRIRVDIGNIDLLKSSLKKYGLFHPVLINDKYELISGFRRLESAKQLGWNEIEVKIIDSPTKIDLIERELEENLVRKDFTDIELKNAYERLHKLQYPSKFKAFFRRLSNFIKNLFIKKKS